MNNSPQKSALLDAMGIPQWTSRIPDAGSPSPVTEEQAADQATAGNAEKVAISGHAASGWLWLTEDVVAEKERRLLIDIQRAVNCRDGGMLAWVDTHAPDSITLTAVIQSELITRLVVFGSRQFQELMTTGLKFTALAKVETLPLAELEQSPTAKRQLWSDLKKLLVN